MHIYLGGRVLRSRETSGAKEEIFVAVRCIAKQQKKTKTNQYNESRLFLFLSKAWKSKPTSIANTRLHVYQWYVKKLVVGRKLLHPISIQTMKIQGQFQRKS